MVDYTYDLKLKSYADPEAKILDYQNFREWASQRYFKPQIAAIRAADRRHMVTISNHSRVGIGLWEGAARYFIGYEVPEQIRPGGLSGHPRQPKPVETEAGADDRGRGAPDRVQDRYCNAFARKPLIIEEFTFASPDPNRVAEGQAKMVLGTVGMRADG